MATRKSPPVDWKTLLAGISRGTSRVEYGATCEIFHQGQPADSLLYLRRGKVKLTVTSKHGKEATLAVRRAGEFFGEGCLAGQRSRTSTATAMTGCTLDKLEKLLMTRILHERHDISESFVAHLLSCNIRYEADLVDHYFNSSEKRLARILLLLSHFGDESRAELVVPRVDQTNLAQMVGTTRSRVNHLMSKFRNLGFIDISNNGGLTVRGGLLNVVLHD